MTRSEMDSNDLMRLDLNDVSRFIDQTMDEPEHDRAVAHLSTSDADAELVADVTYMLGDLEAQDAEPVAAGAGVGVSDDAGVIPFVPPSTARTRPRRVPTRWLALAAVLAGMMLIPLALSRTGAGVGDSGDFAVLLANRQAGLPAGLAERPRWSETRGGGSTVAEVALAARLGALNTDLAVAIHGRQAEQTQDFARKIVARVAEANIPGSSFATVPYSAIESRAAEEPQALGPLLAEGRRNIAALVDTEAFGLGAWAEAARIAAEQRDAAFFRTRDSRRMLNRAAKLESLDGPTRTSIDALRAVGRVDGEPDWAAVGAHADKLLRHLAR